LTFIHDQAKFSNSKAVTCPPVFSNRLATGHLLVDMNFTLSYMVSWILHADV